MGASFTPDVIRLLRADGCTFIRQGKGDHQVWYSPRTKRNFSIDGKTLSRHSANAYLVQAGLPKAF